MNVAKFRKQININSKVIVEGKEYKIKQLVKFRLADGDWYMRLFFTDGNVLADDLGENIFILVKKIETDFELPFPKKLVYQNKEFKFSYDARAVAEEVFGEGVFRVGDSEKFWDYEAEDGSYLSLGIDDKTGKRMDLVGKIVKQVDVTVINQI